MFAVGSNPEAANVSGVNVKRTIIGVFVLAGVLYAVTGFIEAARIGSNSASTGLNYELDAIAACVIGGVSFVGGIGKIRGVIVSMAAGVKISRLEELFGNVPIIRIMPNTPVAVGTGVVVYATPAFPQPQDDA